MLNQNEQVIEQIKKAKNILITFNKTWSGDAVSSALATYLILKKLDKNVEIAAEKFQDSKIYNFLPGYNKICDSLDNLRKFIISLDITNTKVDKIKYQVEKNSLDFVISPKEGFFTADDIKSRTGNFKYDLIITIDTPDLESLGSIYDNDTEFFYNTPLINIGHSSNNEEYGQINYVELTKIACSEIIYDIFVSQYSELFDEDIATCLLAGIISKTKSFKTQNITPQVLTTSSRLISLGGRREEIVNKLYRSRSLNVLKIWGRVLARLTSSMNNSLVWSSLNLNDFAKTQTNEKALDDVIDELIVNIPQAKIVVLFFEKEEFNKKTKERYKSANALVFSIKNINSLELVKSFNPEGTKYLAKIKSKKSVLELEEEVITQIKDKLEKLAI